MPTPFYALIGRSAGGAPAPTVTSVNHPMVPVETGATVTATGTNFVSGATFQVLNGVTVVASGATTFGSSTSLTFVAPPLAGTLYTLRIINPDAQFADLPTWFEYWSPAQLNLTAYLKSYAGRPWVSAASAGSSGSTGNWTEAADSIAPSVGATVNGVATASFDGTDDRLVSASAAGSFVSTAAGAIFAVFERPSSPVAPATDFYDDPPIVAASTGNMGLVVTSSGVRGGIYGGGTKQTAHITCGAGWHTAALRWNGTDVRTRLDTTDATPVAAASSDGLGNLQLARQYTGAKHLQCRMLEVLLAAAFTDADLAKMRDYYRLKYPAAGLP